MIAPAAPLTGFVAQILNSRELVLTIGSEDGVQKGMYFDVLDPRGEDIRDPTTGGVLGSLRRRKVQVRVTDVRERLCVAATYRKTRVNIGGHGFAIGSELSDFSRSLLPAQWIVKHESLRSKDKNLDELDERDSYVKIGDPVIQVAPPGDEGRSDSSSLQQTSPGLPPD